MKKGGARADRRDRHARRSDTGRADSSAPRHSIPAGAPPLPLTHPAMLLVLLVAAAGLVLSVSFRLIDTDFWQHLVVGKAIWTHGIPREHQWTWPWYGTAETSWVGRSGWSPSWLFRALIWPVWQAGGITGLFAWRWITTLAAFGCAWLAVRKIGARGLAPLVVIVWCSLLYRHRSQIRPETLASVWLALTFALLVMHTGISRGAERRTAAADADGFRLASRRLLALDAGLVAVACLWANSHISYFLFFVVLGAWLLDAWRREHVFPARLALTGAIALAACFLNPYGWQVLWQPFAYWLHLRNEPLFLGIGELHPLSWANNQTDGVFVMIALWPLLLLWRATRAGFDLAETILCAFFTDTMTQSERFFGFYAIAAAVYLSRDADAAIRAVRWPRWSATPAARAALASVAIVAAGAAEWARADRPLEIAIDWRRFPVGAMDFMAAHGVRGRGFSQYRVGAYQLWRFWPERDRLPWMDIHNTGTPADRDDYVAALSRRDGWRQLDGRRHFDYVVLDPFAADSLLAALDDDPTMRLVFVDDTGVLYARRGGVNGAVADSFGYRLLGGSGERPSHVLNALSAARADTAAPPNVRANVAALRGELLGEIARMTASSPRSARAHSTAATLAITEQRWDDARTELKAALKADPGTPMAHFRLAGLALTQQRPQDAMREYELERAAGGDRPGIDFGLGMARRAAGDEAGARKAFEREIRRWPGAIAARAAEEALTRPR